MIYDDDIMKQLRSADADNEQNGPLKLTFRVLGHTEGVTHMVWSPKGDALATVSSDGSVIFYSDRGRRQVDPLAEPPRIGPLTHAGYSRDGRLFAVSSKVIHIWELRSGQRIGELGNNLDWIRSFSWSPDSRRIVEGGSPDGKVRVYNARNPRVEQVYRGHRSAVNAVSWSPDGAFIASGDIDGRINVWDAFQREPVPLRLNEHHAAIQSMAWAPRQTEGETLWLASGAQDSTICIWDVREGRLARLLQWHAGPIKSLDFSGDGSLLVARSADGRVSFWNTANWHLATFHEVSTSRSDVSPVAFNPARSLLAVATRAEDTRQGWQEADKYVHVFRYDRDAILAATPPETSAQYRNARVVLVGNSGVGKTALGDVLIGRQFQPTKSTHARRILLFSKDDTTAPDGGRENRETMLWDLAGQYGYREIHQLYLKEVNVALVVFDSQKEDNPLAGVKYWARVLRQIDRDNSGQQPPMRMFLVAARTELMGNRVATWQIEQQAQELGFEKVFFTSAQMGWHDGSWGVEDLRQAVRAAINWEHMPAVKHNSLFEDIKNFLLESRAPGEKILVDMASLFWEFMESKGLHPEAVRGLNLERLSGWFDVCIQGLESRGLIKKLSFGNYVLLRPEHLDSYASAILRAASEDPTGLGSIPEEVVERGEFHIPPDERVQERENELDLITATVRDLLLFGIALKEERSGVTYLVFPSQFRKEARFEDTSALPIEITYYFEGPVMNIYATLTNALSTNRTFRKVNMWRNLAVFSAVEGDGQFGIYLTNKEDAEGELKVFFRDAPDDLKHTFDQVVNSHLEANAENVERRRQVFCPNCGQPYADDIVSRLIGENRFTLNCLVCGTEFSIVEDETRYSEEVLDASMKVQQEAENRRKFEGELKSAEGEMGTPGFQAWVGGSQGLVALVITDIVGSTKLGQELGNFRMKQLLDLHFSQVNHLLDRYDGYHLNNTGDGSIVAFRTVDQALDYILHLYDDTGDPGVDIRAALHVGAVYATGNRYYSSTINYAARMVDIAEKGGVCISDWAYLQLVHDRPPRFEDLQWSPVEDVTLRGFEGQQRVWFLDNA